jgi:hypothetical protein
LLIFTTYSSACAGSIIMSLVIMLCVIWRLIKFLPCRGLSAAFRPSISEQSRADKPTRRFAALRCPLSGLRVTG